MILTIILILLVIVLLLFYSYKTIIKHKDIIEQKKNEINFQLDNRFQLFEKFIHSLTDIMNYEQTIFKEVVLLRAQAQTNKIKMNSLAQLEAENKISKVIAKLDLVIKEYPQFNQIENIEELKNQIQNKEKELIVLKEEYNLNISVYKRLIHNFPFNVALIILEKKLNYYPITWPK